jgi:GT2 family glycosyltransferase
MISLGSEHPLEGDQYSYSVSAVTVNFNGGDRVITCIKALLRQNVPLREIIVVDNGSSDGSLEALRENFQTVQIIELGENRGLLHATSNMVLLLDNDVYVASDCIRNFLHAYENNRAEVICPRIILFPACETIQCEGASAHFIGTMTLRHAYRPVKGSPQKASNVGACIGACMLLERKKILYAGGFDEIYSFYFEDLEFSLRMRALGHTIFCEPSAIVFHDPRSGTPGLSFRGKGDYPLRRAYLNIRHRLLTMFIHYRFRTIIVLLPVLTIYELATLTAALMRGWGAQWAGAWAWHFKNMAQTRRRRVLMQATRLKNDRELLEGGPLPLAPGFIRSQIVETGVAMLSMIFNLYWRFARRWIG